MALALLLQSIEPPLNWAALGVGGVLAGMMFYFYRQDRKASEERLHGIIDGLRKDREDFRSIIESNTRAMTALEKAIEQRDHEGR